MTEPYIIRLNGPWEMASDAQNEPLRVKLPGSWPQILLTAKEQAVVLRRWFHRPTGIDDGSRVQLHLIDLPFAGSAQIDETSLGEFPVSQQHAMNVKEHLATRSRLTITIKTLAPLEKTIPTPQISLAILPDC
ncbi:hypothetical protein C5Y96_04230 [Blastopirellula marina]|uniref:Uncharacterized protein n=2 Tax=Pirellulales TaxID=2691354 RepID=A0A2S8G3R6_9BACT|nr:hypothetical protein C5Y96_04230 [Blastopirellula marina]RCS55385.1 hypothetical protein DTL36_04235 [Bremerella cremea]